jgi:elongation factor G
MHAFGRIAAPNQRHAKGNARTFWQRKREPGRCPRAEVSACPSAAAVTLSRGSATTLTVALRDLTRSGDGVVVLCGSAYRNRGIEPLLDAVVEYLPSPVDVPPVRGTWDGEARQREADPAAPFAALVFKVVATATGRLTYLRVYSGTVHKGTEVFDAGARRTERVARILRVQADRHIALAQATAGDIVAVVGPKAARVGASLCAPAAPVLLEPPVTAEPIVAVAVEARRSADTERLATALAQLVDGTSSTPHLSQVGTNMTCRGTTRVP